MNQPYWGRLILVPVFVILSHLLACKTPEENPYKGRKVQAFYTYYSNDSLNFSLRWGGSNKIRTENLLKGKKLALLTSRHYSYLELDKILNKIFSNELKSYYLLFQAQNTLNFFDKNLGLVYKEKVNTNDSGSIKRIINLSIGNYRKSFNSLPPIIENKGIKAYSIFTIIHRKGKKFAIADYFVPYENHLIRLLSCVCFKDGFQDWAMDTAAFPKLYKNRIPKVQLVKEFEDELFNSFDKLYLRPDTGVNSDPFEMASIAFTEKDSSNYLLPLIRLRKIKPKLDSDPYSSYGQAMVSYQSLAGNYDSISAFNPPSVPLDSAYTQDSISFNYDFDGFYPVNAKDYILEHALSKKIVLFNESHVNYQHRRFEESLLTDFYKAGFRYLALEALFENSDPLNVRKYPIILSGFYTKEPAFANYIRKAMALGFKLVAYEDTTDCNEKVENCNFRRDSIQAVNISNILKKDPGAKILVHAGYDHIQKKNIPNWHPMALQLRKMTGIDPYSINQTILSEKGFASNSAITRYLGSRYHPKVPTIFLNSQNRTYESATDSGVYDLLVYHPYRPNLFESDSSGDYIKKIVLKPLEETSYSPQEFILQVFIEKEYEAERDHAVPVFQKTFFNSFKKHPVYLPVNHYRIIIKDQNNHPLDAEFIEPEKTSRQKIIKP